MSKIIGIGLAQSFNRSLSFTKALMQTHQGQHSQSEVVRINKYDQGGI